MNSCVYFSKARGIEITWFGLVIVFIFLLLLNTNRAKVSIAEDVYFSSISGDTSIKVSSIRRNRERSRFAVDLVDGESDSSRKNMKSIIDKQFRTKVIDFSTDWEERVIAVVNVDRLIDTIVDNLNYSFIYSLLIAHRTLYKNSISFVAYKFSMITVRIS